MAACPRWGAVFHQGGGTAHAGRGSLRRRRAARLTAPSGRRPQGGHFELVPAYDRMATLHRLTSIGDEHCDPSVLARAGRSTSPCDDLASKEAAGAANQGDLAVEEIGSTSPALERHDKPRSRRVSNPNPNPKPKPNPGPDPDPDPDPNPNPNPPGAPRASCRSPRPGSPESSRRGSSAPPSAARWRRLAVALASIGLWLS
jgi:hypothetical protein